MGSGRRAKRDPRKVPQYRADSGQHCHAFRPDCCHVFRSKVATLLSERSDAGVNDKKHHKPVFREKHTGASESASSPFFFRRYFDKL
jgi:hypothetical protein